MNEIIKDHYNNLGSQQSLHIITKKKSLKIIIIIWDHVNHYVLLQKNEIIRDHYNNLGSQKSLQIVTNE